MTKALFRASLILIASTLLVAGCVTPNPTGSTPTHPPPALSLPEDLPPDADRTLVARQLALMARGLYLTKVGEVRALPAKYAKASWAGGDKAPPAERAAPRTDERIKILIDERQTK